MKHIPIRRGSIMMVEIKITNGMMIEQLVWTALVSTFRLFNVIIEFNSINMQWNNEDLIRQYSI